MVHHNFVRTHDSLKKLIKKQIKGKVWGKYKKQTPMMSIGITDHIWTLKEFQALQARINKTVDSMEQLSKEIMGLRCFKTARFIRKRGYSVKKLLVRHI